MSLVIIMRKIAESFIASFAFFALLTTLVFAQNPAPMLKVVTPSEGQTIYGNKVPILLLVENFQLVDYQTNKLPQAGQGHIHLWLDDTSPTPESAVKLASDEFTFSDVAYSNHTLRAELVNNNHTSFAPPVVVVENFTNEAVGSPAPTPTSGFDKNTALVILVVVALVIIAAWWYTKEEDEETKTESKSQRSKSKVIKKRTVKKSKSRGRR